MSVNPWDIKNSFEIIDKAIDEHKCASIIGMMSGGHDSLVSCHIVAQHPSFDFIAHINTGIGIEETRQYARDVCDDMGWQMKEFKAADCGQSYRDIVIEHGFPGPFAHRMMYSRLKERPIRQMCRDYGMSKTNRPLLTTGIRRSESRRRMGRRDTTREGNRVWCNPISEMTDDQKWKYIEDHNLPKNPIALKLCMSGECLCGAFAHPGELAELKEIAPDSYSEIMAIEAEVRSGGLPWGWQDSGPPNWYKEEKQGQEFMFDMRDELRPLCSDCELRQTVDANDKLKGGQA